MKSVLVAGATALALSSAPVAAAPVADPYSALFVFGDSLSDTGNVFAATPTPEIPFKVPAGPYVDGRFSNGPIWADALIGDFAAAGKPAFGLAYGLANAAFDGPSLDLAEQIDLFDDTGLGFFAGPRPLATLWFGANDVFGATDAGLPAATVAAVGAGAAQAVAGGVAALAARGFADFLVFNLPDLSVVPAYTSADPGRADEAGAGSAAFNAALPGALAALPGDLRVTLLDIDALFDALRADPLRFGVSNVTDACFPGDALAISLGFVSGCDAATLATLTFFDNVHPTATIHAAIADAARATLAPVPLPAPALLLIGGLAALAALRRPRA